MSQELYERDQDSWLADQAAAVDDMTRELWADYASHAATMIQHPLMLPC